MDKRIARDLLSIGAVFLRPDQPFTWASGIKSPIYCDNRLTLTAPRVRDDIEKLNAAFDGSAQSNLQAIAKTLAMQAEKSTDLSSRIEQFAKATNKYVTQIDSLVSILEKTEQKLVSINEIENKASAQLKKLDEVIEEKKISYNLRDLQRSLEGYDNNVRKVSDFINKDVADVLSENAKKIDEIRKGEEALQKDLLMEKETVEQLLVGSQQTTELLKKIADTKDVNEEYIYAVIDKWAESRKVKTKK